MLGSLSFSTSLGTGLYPSWVLLVLLQACGCHSTWKGDRHPTGHLGQGWWVRALSDPTP